MSFKGCTTSPPPGAWQKAAATRKAPPARLMEPGHERRSRGAKSGPLRPAGDDRLAAPAPTAEGPDGSIYQGLLAGRDA